VSSVGGFFIQNFIFNCLKLILLLCRLRIDCVFIDKKKEEKKSLKTFSRNKNKNKINNLLNHSKKSHVCRVKPKCENLHATLLAIDTKPIQDKTISLRSEITYFLHYVTYF